MSPVPVVPAHLEGLEFVVRNTFICAVGVEAATPSSALRCRAKTFDVAAFGGAWAGEDRPRAHGGAPGAPAGELAPCGLAAASVAERAFDPAGSLELAEEVVRFGPGQARIVAAGLRGHVREASRSSQAHRVLLALISALGAEEAAFIPEELVGEGRRASSNVHGHAVLCALLRRWPGHPATAALVDEVLADAAGVCGHKFGHLVALEVLAHGLTAQRSCVLASLAGHVQRFARHRFASQVLERALQQNAAPPAARDVLVAELVRHSGGLANLACHCFGTHVVRTLLNLPGARERVLQALMGAQQRLQKDRYGVTLLQEAGLVGAVGLAASPAFGGA